MDLNSVRRASSAGYRFPDRSRETGRSAGSAPPAANRARYDRVEARAGPDPADAVKEDQLWKDIVLRERRVTREWENNWSFLWKYDHMGRLRREEPLPACVSFFSAGPNTSNQMFSSRLFTPLGRELIRLDRSCLWPGSRQHKHKSDPEKLPCWNQEGSQTSAQ
ncbi:uncharacterized protein C2orf50 homolog [Kryptolebias marmoratus]|uniref:uncharacterized protein C2orf50 homolog n=1 Tax=Kryptolebias marmoratus TaxID=37003 RepID=UPI0007F91F22|nr:uncharacterized protein C2orf50 homolog [Kryptolebias marmoratus]